MKKSKIVRVQEKIFKFIHMYLTINYLQFAKAGHFQDTYKLNLLIYNVLTYVHLDTKVSRSQDIKVSNWTRVNMLIVN